MPAAAELSGQGEGRERGRGGGREEKEERKKEEEEEEEEKKEKLALNIQTQQTRYTGGATAPRGCRGGGEAGNRRHESCGGGRGGGGGRAYFKWRSVLYSLLSADAPPFPDFAILAPRSPAIPNDDGASEGWGEKGEGEAGVALEFLNGALVPTAAGVAAAPAL